MEFIGVALLTIFILRGVVVFILAALRTSRAVLREPRGKRPWIFATSIWTLALIGVIALAAMDPSSRLTAERLYPKGAALFWLGTPATLLYGQALAIIWFFSVGTPLVARWSLGMSFVLAIASVLFASTRLEEMSSNIHGLPAFIVPVIWLLTAAVAANTNRKAGTVQITGCKVHTTEFSSEEPSAQLEQDRKAAMTLWLLSSISWLVVLFYVSLSAAAYRPELVDYPPVPSPSMK